MFQQNFGPKKCPMTFTTMFQASSLSKSCKWKHKCSILELFRVGSARVGSGRLTCDYNAISVQLQLQLPTGTELGKKEKNGVFSGHYVIASILPPERLRPYDDRWNAARSCQKLSPILLNLEGLWYAKRLARSCSHSC